MGPGQQRMVGGGHNRTDEYNALIAGALAGRGDAQIELLPGDQGKWEENKKDVFGHVEYRFFCKGILRSGAVYADRQSAACPLKQ
ncbi:hypothetical protein HYPDE_26628 [Hyphomicrobium denitrificans 1NES1]|uniref:Uncharacterized protein n=1 Tax=Hyphomicrobium denitrificans 1NES1 TaxID=670307 RepID=N0B914_9HYPH|nr:hypothetical protein [Hyphomicrobium denitrificans]AGK57006.1 hypothetical protein HYPDE_26628 [Hyphomicrobium denitrificans 1NES1]